MVTTNLSSPLSDIIETTTEHILDNNVQTRCNQIQHLSSLPPDPPCQLNILGHNGNPLCMNGTEIGILEKTHKVRFCCLLQCQHRMALETQICLEVLCNFTYQPLEGQFPYQKLCALLILSNFTATLYNINIRGWK